MGLQRFSLTVLIIVLLQTSLSQIFRENCLLLYIIVHYTSADCIKASKVIKVVKVIVMNKYE